MNTKRGLNSAMTALLLIALAIAAIIIIWTFLKTGLVDLSSQIKTECVTLRLEPESCIIKQDNSLQITLKRNPGSEKTNLKTAKLLFTFIDGDSLIKEFTDLPNTISQFILLPQVFPSELLNKQVKGIRAAAIIDYEDKMRACSFSNNEISCFPERITDEGSTVIRGQICGDNIVEGTEVCDDGALNGQPNQCNTQCDGIVSPPPTPIDCSDSTTITFQSWYKDPFTGQLVSDFWADKDPQWTSRWTISNGEMISNSNGELFLIDLTGDFSIEMGWHIYVGNSFGFFTEYPGDDGFIYRIYYKWSGNGLGLYRLRAYRDRGNYINGVFERDTATSPPFVLGRQSYRESEAFDPVREIDIKLVRIGNLFTWYYRYPPITTWTLYTQQTITDAKPILNLYFDEGSNQALTYVQFESATSGTFPCEQ